MLTLLAFLATIGILVTVHEFGHFQVARWCGVRVLQFSIGFGKPLWQRHVGQENTLLTIGAIPLGGFVKMLDERELADESNHNDKKIFTEQVLKSAFNRQAIWKKMLIVLAGPVANLLLAILLYWLLMLQGVTLIKPKIGEIAPNSIAQQAQIKPNSEIKRIDGEPVKSWQDARWLLMEKSVSQKKIMLDIEFDSSRQEKIAQQITLNLSGLNQDNEIDIFERLGISVFQPEFAPIIGKMLDGSPAQKAGLQIGDQVLSINQATVKNWQELVKLIQLNGFKTLNLEIKRGEQIIKLNFQPEMQTVGGKSSPKIGAAPLIDAKIQADMLVKIDYSSTEALKEAVVQTWKTSLFSLKMLVKMVKGEVSLKTLSGPITIADYAGESAKLGVAAFLGFLALVSISIGILNLLPIPVLDGGHLMYYLVEWIKGSPVSDKTLFLGQKIGMMLLFLMMSIAILNDLNRFVAG